MSEIVKKAVTEAIKAYTARYGTLPAYGSVELIEGITEAIAALLPGGDLVGWVQVHPNGKRFFYEVNPLTVHDNGLETYPVYRTPVAVDDAMVIAALNAYHPVSKMVAQWPAESIADMRRALEAALSGQEG